MKRIKLNIIDILLLVLLIAIVVIIVTGITAAKRSAQAEVPVSIAPVSGPPADFAPNLRFEAVAYGLEPDLAERIADDPANRIYNGFKLCDAYITKAVVEPAFTTVVIDGAAQLAEDPAYRNVRFTVEAQLSPTDYYTMISGNLNAYLGSQEVRLGKGYTLKTMTVEVLTTITDMELTHD